MTRPTFDNSGSYNSASAQTSISWNHTIAGGDKYILVHLHFNTNVTNISVTYNSVALTQLGTNNSGGRYGYLFGLVAPGGGTNSVAASWTTSSGVCAVSTSYNNVDQGTPVGTAVTAVGTTSPASMNIATTDNDIAVDFIGATRNSSTTAPTITVDASQTQRVTDASAVASAIRCSASDETASGTVAMSWTVVNFNNYIQLGVPLNGTNEAGIVFFM